jgi:hypothetical protein
MPLTMSDSSVITDHLGHQILSREPLSGEPPRLVRGNAWCYDCEVAIEGFWSVTRGLKTLFESGDHSSRNDA